MQPSLTLQKTVTPRKKRKSSKPLTIIYLVLGLCLVVLGLFGGKLAPYDPLKISMADRFQAPSASHWFGTDYLGRDIASRVMAATSLDLESCLVILTIATVIGMIIGIVSGYYGGIIDEIFMRITDVFFAFPGLILAMAIAAVLGPKLINVVIALTVVWWPSYARLIRGQVLSLRERDFIQASRSLGAGDGWLMVKHFIPNILIPLTIHIASNAAPALVTASALSFIGMGVQPPTPEWGAMLNDGRKYMLDHWWMATFPGLAIAVTVIIFNGLVEIIRSRLSERY
jgi:peptide/nickel transport system permease protein